MKRIVGTTFVLALMMPIFMSSAQTLKISHASVQGGLAQVHGNKAAANADISWEGSIVAKANNGGAFSFAGAVPADCVGTLSDGVSTIDVALSNCTPTAIVLKTGQTQCATSNVLGACPGDPAGQDGEVALQKGRARSYTSNADGTITDNSTGLVWEKLGSLDGLQNLADPHDADNVYKWTDAFNVKIATLNTAPCFAGQCDWRLPNINELLSLADYGRVGPAIDTVFRTGNDGTGDSFTQSTIYSSSTTYQNRQNRALNVEFSDGTLVPFGKRGNSYVRAVRGGS